MLLHPSIVGSGFAALGAATSDPAAAQDLPTAAVMCPDLLQRFAEVSDGRSEQGRVHPVAVVLALCAAAVVAGMASFTAIAGWASDVPCELLAQLYGRGCEPPSKATIWRVVTGADAGAVDAVIGVWLVAQAAAREPDPDAHDLVAIMVDGKSVRGRSTPRATRPTCSLQPPTKTPWCWGRSRSARSPTRCAARRPVVSLIQLGGTRRTVLGFDGLPGAER